MDNDKIFNEDISEEQLSELIFNTFGEDKKNNKFKIIADEIAKRFQQYKEKALIYLKDGQKLEELLLRAEAKLNKVPNVGDKLAYIPQLILLIRSYAVKEYTDISLVEIVLIVAALIYFVSPLDIIPDGMPGGLGFLDDAIVAGIIVNFCKEDIKKYMDWLKKKHDTSTDL